MNGHTRNLFLIVGMMIMFVPLLQSYGVGNSIEVNASSSSSKSIAFRISSSEDAPPIHGFIITIYDGKHYSKISESPLAWSGGTIKYRSAMWVTKTARIEPGNTENNFAIEVRQAGSYRISWTVMDKTMRPVGWGTMTINVL